MKEIHEPSKTKKPIFNNDIADKILMELDGWQLIKNEDLEDNEELFLDIEDSEVLKNIDNNKKVSIGELKYFYDNSFDEALSYSNRYDIDDLRKTEVQRFLKAVIKLTASSVWIKYNTGVTIDNEENTIDYGQGGKLYKKYLTIIEPFIKGCSIEIGIP